MLLGFKTELDLNNKQRTMCARHAGVARHAWNWGLEVCKGILEHNRQSPDQKLEFPSDIDLHKRLVAEVKKKNPWYYQVSKCAPQQALRNLAVAFKGFFEKKAKFPRFKKK
ncbi:MAG: helix-turn-helix domain-containing protein, partial [Gloeomargarita sp. SKYG98]|nr:helix-turn-helix domain-containing protein [Gloeomargarita sp. SKYG98]